MLPVQIKRLDTRAAIPQLGTPGAAAVDLVACIDEPITLHPGQASVLIPTGIAVYHGDNAYAAMILPRSGTGHKNGLVLGNGTGLIDSDYQGQLMVSACIRPGHVPFIVNPGDRIAQLVFTPVVQPDFEVVDEFTTTTARGTGGFGSTGLKVAA